MTRVVRALVASCLLSSLLFIAAPARAQGPAPIEPVVLDGTGPTSVFVHAHPGALPEATAAAEVTGITVAQRYEAIHVFTAIGTPAQFRALAASSSIEWIEANRPMQLFTDSSHVATRSEDLYRGAVDGTVYDGSGIGVAVIDTGVDGTIPALQPALERGANMKILCPIPGAVIRVATVSMSGCPVDTVTVEMEDTDTIAMGGHGTHVAGIVAGAETRVVPSDPAQPTVTARGAAPGSALYSLGAGFALSVDNAMDGLEWVLQNHDLVSPAIRVVNNSWGTAYEDYTDPDAEQPEFFFENGYRLHRALWKMQDELVAEGVTVVFAAGNAGGGLGPAPTTTAQCINPTPGVICVANYYDRGTGSRNGSIDGTSSRGQRSRPETWPDIAAPGTDILSTCRFTLPVCDTGTPVNDEYFRLSGTSMAAPHVAGIVAQVLQANPSLTPAEIEDLLEDTAHKFTWGTPYGRHVDQTNPDDESSFEKGHGLVDARAALEGAESPAEPDPGPDPVVYTASGTILGQAATSFFFEPSVSDKSSISRRMFETTCTPDVPPIDGFVFALPGDLVDGRNILTLSGSNAFGLWDINMWLYDASCKLIASRDGGIFGDVSMTIPAGTRYAVATNHFFGLTTVGATVQPPPFSFLGQTSSNAQYSDGATFAVLATGLDETPLAEAPISFSLEGAGTQTWDALTDGDGVAAITEDVRLAPGVYTLTATYEGSDGALGGVAIERRFEILPEDTTIGLRVEGQGSSRTLIATLLDGDGEPVAGRTVSFSTGSEQIGTSTTDDGGIATLPVPSRYRSNKTTFSASFCGDDFYLPASCS